ncbi:hypothetical protein SAMN05720469_11144 [Fibrobacter intestinalis]|uniref:AMIN domain-containing protein n=1 Tax=Fibrobacter intestinalis TaxID=28122 RepID=A0A1M6TVI7_9BACT|nr:hypothetical protein [Fibrobacter intestinalis]SHK61032.1 hypothetical protein SAMN05720469_11144 [Fibrobacter intestinalis]
MKMLMLLLSFLTVSAFAAEIKSVDYSCGAKDCSLSFQFASAKNLPDFFQKYDAKKQTLVVGFSDTRVFSGEVSLPVSTSAEGIRSVRVFTDNSFKVPLLQFEFAVGSAIRSDKNPVSLSKGKIFVISLPKTKEASWSLKKLAAQAKKDSVNLNAEKAKLSEKDKKQKADSLKQVKSDSVAAAKKAKADSVKQAKEAALKAQKAKQDSLAAAKKAKADSVKQAKEAALKAQKAKQDSLAAAKKAKADSVKQAKEAALKAQKAKQDSIAAAKKAKADSAKQAKEAALKAQKAKQDSVAAVKKAKADSIKQARLDSIQEVKELANKKVVSALIEGVREMTGIQGEGIEQFRITTQEEIQLSMVKGPDKSSIVYVSVPGPKKTPLFNVTASNIVKSVTWVSSGLRIQLQKNVHPMILVYKGSLIFQISSASKVDGFVCYQAKPEGVYVRKWVNPSQKTESFAEFSKEMDTEKKKIVSVAQSFGLRPVSRNLIVVAESAPFLATPEENAQILETLEFGARLEDIELNGLYHKVRLGSKVGYINRRAVSFPDELSAVQSERLKQMAMEQGGTLDSNSVRFDHPIEERVSYSSFGRRDPFVEIKGLMEEGINIDQVELVGIIWESDVPMAILVDAKNPNVSYTVKEGDRILNGKVLKITQTDVLFLLQEFGVSRRYSMSLPDQYGSNAK